MSLSISVVVPTCNRDDLLATCLGKLAPGAQTLSNDLYEVVVSDDGNSPEKNESVASRFPWARWTAGPCRGPAANRNHGASQARGDWIVFTDDDCLPDTAWLEAFRLAAEKSRELQVLEGRTLATGERKSIDTEAPINTHGGFLWSCNFAIRRQLFRELGGFDEAFTAATMEDVDLALRIRKRGMTYKFCSDALVLHPWRPRKGLQHIHAYKRALDYFIQKHPEQVARFTLGPSLRIFLALTFRLGREGLMSHRGRGVMRMAGLECYTFAMRVASAWAAK